MPAKSIFLLFRDALVMAIAILFSLLMLAVVFPPKINIAFPGSSFSRSASELFPGQHYTEIRNLRNEYLNNEIFSMSSYTLEIALSVKQSEEALAQKLVSTGFCQSKGSGEVFGVDVNGYLATAKHNLYKKQKNCAQTIQGEIAGRKLSLTAKDFSFDTVFAAVDEKGNRYDVVPVLEAKDKDVAIMKFSGARPDNFRPLLPLEREPTVGEEVATKGSPIEIMNAVAFGNISRQELFEGGYLVSLPAYPGNSGGALVVLSEMKYLGVVTDAVQAGNGQILNYCVVLPASEVTKLLEKAIDLDKK